tara:strand:+ start:1279 stop:3177 length:1899 start_codon:yes stop_codon:yes gene_type:complete
MVIERRQIPYGTVRDALPVRLGTHKYNIDVSRLTRATIDPIRQGFDTQGQPGEQSLNQAGVWKRSRNDWELGAGQREADSPESGLRQFYESTGINPWVKNELTLLKATALLWSDSSTNLYMATAKSGGTSRTYMCDGPNMQASDNLFGSATAITNPCGDDILGIASDGTNVYVAGNGKVVKITGTSFSTSTDGTDHWLLASVDDVWVANGYLIASVDDRLTVLSVSSVASVNADIASDTFNQVDSWQSVIGTPVGIYAAGNQGQQGRIYYIGINDSTSALNVPVIAAELPVGETINVLTEYGGLVIIGTSKGIRMAQIAGQGYLTYGPRIDIAGGVSYLLSQGEFVYFNWNDYNSSTSGLGRLSLKELTGQLVPAYASDLMYADSTADVQGIVIDDDTLLFSVSGVGVVKESSNYVTSGSINEGRFRWGITELKTAVSVDLRHSILAESTSGVTSAESVAVTLTDDAGNTDTITSDTELTTTPNIQVVEGVTGEYITPTLVITRGDTATDTPTLYRWTVRAIPMPFVAEIIQLPIILTTHTTHDNRDVYQDIYDEYTYIRELLENRALVTFIIGNEHKNVYVSGLAYQEGAISKWSDSEQRTEDRRDRWLEGVLTVQLITVQTGVTLAPIET